ncbi:MAG: dihydropteroate synthase [Acidobacteriota bacterium]
MSEARAQDACPVPSAIVEKLFPHNAHVIGGFDPLPLRLPACSPAFHQVAASHGAYAVRLEGVSEETAEPFLRALGRVGGVAHTTPRAGEVDILLFATQPQVEALRSQLLASTSELSRLAEEVVTTLSAYQRTRFTLCCGERKLEIGPRPLIMGILNCTPDSFYCGSRAFDEEAVLRGRSMVEAGADLLDVGGESTRPGSTAVTVAEEIDRVVPVIEQLAARLAVPISIDTSKARVAEAALAAGATMVNDISGLACDPHLAEVIAAAGVPVVLMHMRGSPATMYEAARYRDLIGDIVRELRQALLRAQQAGIDPEVTLVDPGIGFAKTPQQSFILLRHLAALRSLGRPMVIGPSRKSFIGAVLDLPVEDRMEGTAAAVAVGVLAGAHILRVHDVEAMRRTADVAAAIRSEGVGWIS